MKDREAKSKARRDFFRKAGLGAGALGAAAVGLNARRGEAATETADGKRHKGYRESAHVKKYYELARF